MSEAPVARRLRLHGRVQGVGYRWSMIQEAKRLGVRGWVRNRRDGSVEAAVAGDALAVAAIVVWAKAGPPGARVDTLDDSPEAGPLEPGFVQRPTE